jgi:hypothetical protein
VLIANACVAPYDFFISNCANYSFASTINLLSNAICNYCSQNSGPYQYQAMTAVCILNGQLTSYIASSFVTVTGCVKYDKTSGVCIECGGNFPFLDLLTAATPACIATCIAANQMIIIDNWDGRVNLCVTTTYMAPMIGLRSEAETGNNIGTFCQYAARVAFTTNQVIKYSSPSVNLGQDVNTQPNADDYTCVGAKPNGNNTNNYTQYYFRTILLAQIQKADSAVFSTLAYLPADTQIQPT